MTKFETCTKIFLIDIIKEICQRWVINSYINSRNIEITILLITKLRTVYTNYKKKTLIISQYFIYNSNKSDKNNIIKIDKNIIILWQQLICQGSQ